MSSKFYLEMKKSPRITINVQNLFHKIRSTGHWCIVQSSVAHNVSYLEKVRIVNCIFLHFSQIRFATIDMKISQPRSFLTIDRSQIMTCLRGDHARHASWTPMHNSPELLPWAWSWANAAVRFNNNNDIEYDTNYDNSIMIIIVDKCAGKLWWWWWWWWWMVVHENKSTVINNHNI